MLMWLKLVNLEILEISAFGFAGSNPVMSIFCYFYAYVMQLEDIFYLK